MSNAALGMTMLCLIVVVIMMGFPTAFTLMGLGMLFGYVAFYDPSAPWLDNRIFDLRVQRAYGALTNETLLSIPLFVLMGYVMERGALVDKMFHSVQLAFRSVPGSLAVTTLIICTFWGIAMSHAVTQSACSLLWSAQSLRRAGHCAVVLKARKSPGACWFAVLRCRWCRSCCLSACWGQSGGTS